MGPTLITALYSRAELNVELSFLCKFSFSLSKFDTSLWYLSCMSLSSITALSLSPTSTLLMSSCCLRQFLRFSNSSVTSRSLASSDLRLSWSAFLSCSFYFFSCAISSNRFFNATSCSLSILALSPCNSAFSSCTASYSRCILVISMLACYSNCWKLSRSCMKRRLSLESPPCSSLWWVFSYISVSAAVRIDNIFSALNSCMPVRQRRRISCSNIKGLSSGSCCRIAMTLTNSLLVPPAWARLWRISYSCSGVKCLVLALCIFSSSPYSSSSP